MGFFEDYFVRPVWEHSGYNAVNTIVYASIALAAAYGMYRILRRERIGIDERFILSIIPFILLGSTVRVVTDSIDTGVMQMHRGQLFGLYDIILNSHVYDYGYLTVTPGIYVVVGLLAFASVVIFNGMKRRALIAPFGAALWLIHLAVLAPLFRFYYYAFLAAALAIGGALVGTQILKRMGVKLSLSSSLAVFAHALDGASTFVVIDVFGPAVGKQYFEQHVLSNLLGSIANSFFLFFAIKVLFATAAVYLIEKESETREEKYFIFLLLIIFGLAPGLRDLLRMLVGA